MLRLSLFTFFFYLSQTFAAPAPKVEWSKKPSDEILKAWEEAGARWHCTTAHRTILANAAWPEKGAILAFDFEKVKKGAIAKLPDPETPFQVWFSFPITDPDDVLEELKHFKNLIGIDILYSKTCKGINLKHLTHHKLKILTLADSLCDDETMKSIEKFETLERLHLSSTQISDSCSASISRLKNLKVLKLSDTTIGDKVLEAISQFKQLEHLEIQQTQITDRGIESLSKIESLESLFLGKNALFDKGIKHLAKLKNLKDFLFENSKAPDELLEAISQCPKISSLDFRIMERPKGFSHLTKLKELRNLHLYQTPVEIDDFKSLASIEGLLHIDSWDKGITDETIAVLSKCKSLIWLFFREGNLTDKSVTELTKMTQLRRLEIPSVNLSSEGIKKLKAGLPKCQISLRD